jgi:hypothetical protein
MEPLEFYLRCAKFAHTNLALTKPIHSQTAHLIPPLLILKQKIISKS